MISMHLLNVKFLCHIGFFIILFTPGVEVLCRMVVPWGGVLPSKSHVPGMEEWFWMKFFPALEVASRKASAHQDNPHDEKECRIS